MNVSEGLWWFFRLSPGETPRYSASPASADLKVVLDRVLEIEAVRRGVGACRSTYATGVPSILQPARTSPGWEIREPQVETTGPLKREPVAFVIN